jgi:hypothetical protein
MVAVFIAVCAIFNNRSIARRNRTVDLLLNLSKDESLKSAVKVLRKINQNRAKNNIATFAHSKNENDEKYQDHQQILTLLNHFESVSVCVHHDMYDYKMIRDAMRSRIINVFECSKPYIIESREIENNQKLFIEFERLYLKLKQDETFAQKI